MNAYDRLIARLHKIEALYRGATSPGERDAALRARERVAEQARAARQAGTSEQDRPVEYRFSLQDRWSRNLFIAICRRHGYRPYRYRRQRRQTLMLRAPRSVLDRQIWPEFERWSEAMYEYFNQTMDQILRDVLGERSPSDDVDEVAGDAPDEPKSTP